MKELKAFMQENKVWTYPLLFANAVLALATIYRVWVG